MPGVTTDPVMVLACSPRKGGNSDEAATFLAKGVEDAGQPVNILYLREYPVLPCIGCYRCSNDPHGRCFQEDRDKSGSLFAALMEAPLVCIASPIYFYHLPAHFKAFIDRGQSFYVRRERKDPKLLGLPSKKALVVLVAGRPTGEQLFSGSLLTLRYFLKLFNIHVADPLEFRGKDGPEDLAGDSRACGLIRHTARMLADGLR